VNNHHATPLAGEDYTESHQRHATCWLNAGPTPEGEILPAEVAEFRRLGQLLRDQATHTGL
jgi:hypothetical protein